jgi:hypothetical protein
MARRADAEFDVLLRRASLVGRSACADDHGLLIVGMNFWLHLEKGAKASAIFPRGNTFPFPKIPRRLLSVPIRKHRLGLKRRFRM